MLNVNMNYYNNPATDDMDGTTDSAEAGLLDRTLAHKIKGDGYAGGFMFYRYLARVCW